MLRSSKLSSNRLKLLALIVIAALQTACSSSKLEFWRVMPIQMARVTQTESYTQTYILGPENTVDIGDIPLERREKLDARMDTIFQHLLGARNWQYLKNLYGVNSIRDELIAKQIKMQGMLSFTAYLDPDDVRYTVFEGSGRFFAVRDKTGEILLSGDFHIPPQRYKIKQIQSGCVPLRADIFTTRIPGKPTYYNSATIQYDVIFHKVKNHKNAVAIDYDATHYGYIDLNGDGRYEPSELFAALKLNGRYQNAKVIDFTGLNFVKENYDSGTVAELEAHKAAQEDSQRPCVRDRLRESQP